jgi:hypothetical protein
LNKIPLRKKVGLTQNSVKIILKKIAREYIPDSIINRVKRGFSTPVNQYSDGNENTATTSFNKEERWYLNSVNIQNIKPHYYNK